MCVVVQRLWVGRCSTGNRTWAVITLSLKRNKLNMMKRVMFININLLFTIKKDMVFRTPLSDSWIQDKIIKMHIKCKKMFPHTCLSWFFLLLLDGRCSSCPFGWSCRVWQHAWPAGQQVCQPWILLQHPLCWWVCHLYFFLFWPYFSCIKSHFFFRYVHKTVITLTAFSFPNQFSSIGCRKYQIRCLFQFQALILLLLTTGLLGFITTVGLTVVL